jgi:hypothetical protein
VLRARLGASYHPSHLVGFTRVQRRAVDDELSSLATWLGLDRVTHV